MDNINILPEFSAVIELLIKEFKSVSGCLIFFLSKVTAFDVLRVGGVNP